MDCSTSGFPVLHYAQSSLKLKSIESVMWSNHLILCLPLLLLPSIFPSIRVFQWVGSSHQVAKDLELQLQHQSFQWIFRVDFLLDWRVWSPFCQRTLRSLLQHSAFFKVQLSHLYMTTGKTIALTIWTCVSKVMSLLFNMLSRFVVACLPRCKCLLISCPQSPSAAILESRKIKSVNVSIFSPIYLPWSDGHCMPWLNASFLNAEF